MTATEMQTEALDRARSGSSKRNDVAVIQSFAARGIPVDESEPRENVLTSLAWRALGRQVRRGEKSVRVTTWIPIEEKRSPNGKLLRKAGKRPKAACVFHITQTDAVSV